MKVILAGMNIDASLIELLKKAVMEDDGDALSALRGLIENDAVTPETISAAYARISRSPLSVDQLRSDSVKAIEKARKSNESIIYGMGHGSVAEHAVFNIDLIGVSRLASEFIQEHRLVSFTEKSQRYIRLDKDFIIPEEFRDDSTLVSEFTEMLERQNGLYNRYYTVLEKYFLDKYPDMSKRDISGKAKEDARYVLSMATTSQMGMTVNARNLEYMIKRLSACQNFELQKLGKSLYRLVHEKVPSLIVFSEPGEYDFKPWEGTFNPGIPSDKKKYEPVRLVSSTVDGDMKIAAGAVFKNSRLDYEDILENRLDTEQIYSRLWEGLNFYDSMDRVFELAGATFQLTMSASCYAQVKRHRMATILRGDYDPDLGVMVPDSIKEIDEEKSFLDMMDSVNELYERVRIFDRLACNYVLTNAHRRNIVMKADLREWYHFVRLRSDAHAQWEVRALSHRIEEELKRIYPLATRMLMGKDAFIKNRN